MSRIPQGMDGQGAAAYRALQLPNPPGIIRLLTDTAGSSRTTRSGQT